MSLLTGLHTSIVYGHSPSEWAGRGLPRSIGNLSSDVGNNPVVIAKAYLWPTT